jgi:hypothetical protein
MPIRLWLPFLMFPLLAGGAAAEEGRSWSLTLFGGGQRYAVYGTTAEYVRGANDFPVTPAHMPVLAGLSIGRTSGRFLFELDGRWTFPSRIRLTDPSDGDTVAVKSAAHASVVLNIVFSPFGGSLRPYAAAGGGLDVVLGGDATYTSASGFVIDVPAPRTADRFDPEVHAGGGFLILPGPVWGFRLDLRAVWVFDKPRTVRSAQASAGLILRF